MMNRIRNMKSIVIAGGLVVALAVSFFLGGMVMMKKSEANAAAAAKQELENRSDKDIAAESDSFNQTSRKFAKDLLSRYAERPLLDENAQEHWGDSSLENMINDMNAGHSAKQAICAICEEADIDVNTATIGDLTEEQIVEIDKAVFRNSDHPL